LAIKAALGSLDAHPEIVVRRTSSLFQTAPIGLTAQSDFLNAVAEIESRLSPEDLLATTLHIENLIGRKRTHQWGPRVIDLDVLLYGDHQVVRPGISIPHPRMYERAFVLVPLAELAPDLKIPTDASSTFPGETVCYRADRLAKSTRIERVPWDDPVDAQGVTSR
jgi:2-amino-4-hydroxy-6-hydroxymethyldihydropteridine diphosphokinase